MLDAALTRTTGPPSEFVFQVGITLAHAIWRLVKTAGRSDGSRDRVDCQRWIFTAEGPCAQLIWCNGRRRNQIQLSDRSSKFWHLRIWAQSRHSTKNGKSGPRAEPLSWPYGWTCCYLRRFSVSASKNITRDTSNPTFTSVPAVMASSPLLSTTIGSPVGVDRYS